MRTFTLATALALAVATLPAVAQDVPTASGFGRPDCRIVAVDPAPTGVVTWTGGCKDGFADGPGTMSWPGKKSKIHRLTGTLERGVIQGEAELALADGTIYSSTFKDGSPDGKGVVNYRDGGIYEGELRRGKREGTGIAVFASGDRYEGTWHKEVQEGQGRMIYLAGGEYVGEWHAGKRHGHGVLTYAGSGRRFEGEFVDGRIAGSAPPPARGRTYDAVVDPGSNVALPTIAGTGFPVPPDVGYEALTPEQKRTVNSYYQALEEGDEPPYPVGGPQEFVELISKISGKLRVRGKITIYANVGADGKVTSVGMVGLENPELRRFASAAAAVVAYKPAVCRGQPCAMTFPITLNMTLDR
jgi:hypothetical protein